MEHLSDALESPWSLVQFALVARQLGRWHGYGMKEPLPAFAWLCRRHVSSWLERFAPEPAWVNPFVHRFFPERLRTRVTELWGQKERFCETLDRLPLVFSHFDLQRRNLFIRKRGESQEVIAIDWAQCGIGALGGDLYALIGISTMLVAWEANRLAELEAGVLGAYLLGLREMGWRGDAEAVRLAYSAWLGMYFGVGTPAFTALWTSKAQQALAYREFGCPPEVLAERWASICEFCLTRAEEALRLMARLSLG